MLSDLTLKMKTAAGSAHLPTSPTASVVWGITLADATRAAGYAAIDAVLNAILGPAE